ncbi:hypothetical protein C8R46DRAFT_1108226 [Mycena filopes]|nr:hypothetical protein C8R46DRAFT_1108226 [Mycena filopes]
MPPPTHAAPSAHRRCWCSSPAGGCGSDSEGSRSEIWAEDALGIALAILSACGRASCSSPPFSDRCLPPFPRCVHRIVPRPRLHTCHTPGTSSSARRRCDVSAVGWSTTSAESGSRSSWVKSGATSIASPKDFQFRVVVLRSIYPYDQRLYTYICYAPSSVHFRR